MSFTAWLVTGWTPYLVALALGLVGTLVGGEWRRRVARRRVRDYWGRHDPERLREVVQIAPWHHFEAASLPDDLVVDERTAADLHLDDLFRAMDHTISRIGQQALYHRLRVRQTPAELQRFEAQLAAVAEDQALRERAQMALMPLDDTALYGVWRLTLPSVMPFNALFRLAPLAPLLLVISLVAAAFTPLALLGALVAMVLAIVLRVKVAWRVNAVVTSFRQLGRLFTGAAALATLPGEAFEPTTARLQQLGTELGPLRWMTRWLGRSTAEDPLSLLLEYLNLMLLTDLNLLLLAERRLTSQGAQLRALIHEIGGIDVILSVASWRTTRSDWCRPTFTAPGSPVVLDGAWHPLLTDPVPQDLRLSPPAGILITGSNMSGKSTLLRTVGVAMVMAETVHTAPARQLTGPPRMVRTCIGRADDLLGGRSYYLAEVERVLALLAATQRGTPHLLLFDELFRGTNTIERIAAGEAVLRALVAPAPDGGTPHLVLAATHDGELVELLDSVYAPWHYGESLDADGLHFDYRLRPGPTTTRNAVALLAMHGAPEALITAARARVVHLDQRRLIPLGEP